MFPVAIVAIVAIGVGIVFVARGRNEVAGISSGLTLEAATPTDVNASCPWIVEREGCARVDQTAVVTTLDGVALVPGAPEVFEDVGFYTQMLVTRARALALVDSTCADGSGWLAYDVDLAILTRSSL